MYHKGQEIWLVEYPVMKGVIVSDPPEHIAGYGFVDVSVQYGEEIYISNLLYQHWTFLIH